MEPAELHIPPDARYVGLARLVVCAAARQAGMAGERVEDLRIAVSEATANAVHAHEQAAIPSPVVLRFGLDQQAAFVVEILDTGPGFEPVDSQLAGQRDWRQESGLGVTIIRGLADEVRFLRSEGMQVSLRFAVALHGDQAEAEPSETERSEA